MPPDPVAKVVSSKPWLASLAAIPIASGLAFVTALTLRVEGLFNSGTNADAGWKLALIFAPWLFPLLWIPLAAGRVQRDRRSSAAVTRILEARNVCVVTLAVWTACWTFGAAITSGAAWFVVAPFAFGAFPFLAVPLLLPQRLVFQWPARVSIVLGVAAGAAWLALEVASPSWEPSPSAAWLQVLAAILGLAAAGTAAVALSVRAIRPSLGASHLPPMSPSTD